MQMARLHRNDDDHRSRQQLTELLRRGPDVPNVGRELNILREMIWCACDHTRTIDGSHRLDEPSKIPVNPARHKNVVPLRNRKRITAGMERHVLGYKHKLACIDAELRA